MVSNKVSGWREGIKNGSSRRSYTYFNSQNTTGKFYFTEGSLPFFLSDQYNGYAPFHKSVKGLSHIVASLSL